jgi:hypothetical protein
MPKHRTSEDREMVIKILIENPGIGRERISKITGIPAGSIQNWINDLRRRASERATICQVDENGEYILDAVTFANNVIYYSMEIENVKR